MNFKLTQEQQAAVLWGREFAAKELAPGARERDEKAFFDRDLMKKMADAGFFQVSVKEEYGGRGDGLFVRSLIAEEFAKECVSSAVNYTIGMGGLCVLKYDASEAQKIKYIPPIVKGDSIATFAMTERTAGSDPSGAKTTAMLDGDAYIINGSKCFITHGGQADVHVLFALTQPEKGTKGMSAFIVPASTPGFSVGNIHEKMGMRSCELCELKLENCRIPKENLIGEENKAYKYAMLAIDEGKINVCFIALGLAERALSESIAYMKSREQFGEPIANFQGLRWYIADMACEIEAARLLSYKAAIAGDERDPEFNKLAAMAKLYATEAAMRVVDKAIEIHGGNGFTKDYVVERLYRDIQGLRIYDGTSEVQKIVISKHYLR